MNAVGHLAFTLALAVLAAFALGAASQIGLSPYDPVGGRVFPQYVAGTLLALCLVLAATQAAGLRRVRDAKPALAVDRRSVTRVGALLALVAGGIGLVELGVAGLTGTIFTVILAGSLLLAPPGSGRDLARLVVAGALVALAVSVGALLLFETVLRIRLP
jgi:hypothetical protein